MCKHKLCLMPFSVFSVPDFLPEISYGCFLTRPKIIIMKEKEEERKKKKKNSKTKDQGREKWAKKKTASWRIEGVRQCHQG